jgi:hypothetical protein
VLFATIELMMIVVYAIIAGRNIISEDMTLPKKVIAAMISC